MVAMVRWGGSRVWTTILYIKKAVVDLGNYYHNHGYQMLLLKGLACGVNWPKPEHRPYGDIDIYLFGKQKEADVVLARELGIKLAWNDNWTFWHEENVWCFQCHLCKWPRVWCENIPKSSIRSIFERTCFERHSFARVFRAYTQMVYQANSIQISSMEGQRVEAWTLLYRQYEECFLEWCEKPSDETIFNIVYSWWFIVYSQLKVYSY